MTARLPTLLRGASLAVVLLGFAAMALGGDLRPPVTWAVLALLAFSLVPGRPRLPTRAWVGIQLAFLAWLAVRGFLLRHGVLGIFADLLLFVQLHRVLTRRGGRDDLYAAFIAFGQLLLASIRTFDLLFFVVFVAFLIAVTWTLLLARLSLAVEAQWAEERRGPVPAERWRELDGALRWPWLVVVGGLNLAMLAGTLGLFFVLPRMQLGMLSSSMLPPTHVSGFGDQVRLGDVGRLQLSREPVLRLRATDPRGAEITPEGLYWEGLALDYFDGRTWTVSDPGKLDLMKAGRPAPPRKSPWSLRVEVTREPLDSDVLFTVAETAGLYGDFDRLRAGSTDSMHLPGERRRVSYVVYTNPGQPGADALRAVHGQPVPDDLRRKYTQLPSIMSPEIGRLAREWAAGAPTDVDRALLLLTRLRDDFVYTLEQPAARYEDPIEAFLTQVQEGHCEYFATAYVLMLRSLGVPSRIVNGFAGTERSPVGDYWVVRQSDAHSWAEVWFPEHGWVIFDPTPTASGGLQGAGRVNVAARVRAWMDHGRLVWSELMLDYGADHQLDAIRRSLAGVMALSDGGSVSDVFSVLAPSAGREGEAAAVARVPWRGVLLGGATAAALVLWAFGRAAPRRRRSPWDGLLRRWQRAANRAGEGPGRGATLAAWARWAAQRDPQRFGQAPALVQRWYAARFADGSWARADVRAIASLRAAAWRWRPGTTGSPPTR